MLEVCQLHELDPHSPGGIAWEQLVQRNPGSGVMQSLHWAAFKRQRGFRILHLGLEDSGSLIGGVILYAPAITHNASLFVATEGPVLPWHDPGLARQGLRLLRAAAEAQATAFGVIGMRIEPRVCAPLPLLRDWGRAPVDLMTQETLYLELTPGEEAILAQMKPKGRYNIGLAQRHGVQVRETVEPADFQVFYDLLDEAGQRDDFFIEPIDHFDLLLAQLVPAGHARLLLAEHSGQPLAGMILTIYGERATYLYGGIANIQRKVMAGYALQWAAIQAARQAGCRTYDFYGFEPHGDPNHQFAGFSRFKRQFGGTPVRFVGAHDFYWTDRLADAIVRAVGEVPWSS